MREGLYGIQWPDSNTAYNLIFSPTRGLVFWTPFLITAAAGYWRVLHSNRIFWLSYAVPLVQIVVISGRTWDWLAGPTIGPRYLAPILPLLALPCAFGVQRFPKMGFVLAVYSILITTFATLTDACAQYNIYNPLTELHWPLFTQGKLSPNIGLICGLTSYTSVVTYYGLLLAGIWWIWRGRQEERKLLPAECLALCRL
jgi:hypothetical protein